MSDSRRLTCLLAFKQIWCWQVYRSIERERTRNQLFLFRLFWFLCSGSGVASEVAVGGEGGKTTPPDEAGVVGTGGFPCRFGVGGAGAVGLERGMRHPRRYFYKTMAGSESQANV